MSDYVGGAKELLERISSVYDSTYGFSTAGVQIYDTAWLAMVTKRQGNAQIWSFESSFYYLLQTQQEDGGWGKHDSSQTVGIVDTSAALLALIKHEKRPLQLREVSSAEMKQRIARGKESLHKQLRDWSDLIATNHIAVELTVPAMLRYLQEEDPTMEFRFPAQTSLTRMAKARLESIDLEKMYAGHPSSALHSLECFIGELDFDRVAAFLHHGSMFASPSSTAAFLNNASTGNDEAEAYLQTVLQRGSGHAGGGVPGTYPTTHFEIAWVVTTLIEAGFSAGELVSPALDHLTDILRQGLSAGGGILGFAPGTVDVDDTAKALTALSYIDKSGDTDARKMVRVFHNAVEGYFITFPGGERDPSITSNINALMALLVQPTPDDYMEEIVSTATFVIDTWWNHDGLLKDKWHQSPYYTILLFVNTLLKLLTFLDSGKGRDTHTILQQKTTVCLFQAFHRTLLKQADDGGWGDAESTSFAVLILASARRLHLFHPLREDVEKAVQRGTTLLHSVTSQPVAGNWTSKTAYSVRFVADAYRLAALHQADKFDITPDAGLPLSDDARKQFDQYLKLAEPMPLFQQLPEWKLRASLLEAQTFIPLLRGHRAAVFDREAFKVTDDDFYLDLIPWTWISCSNLHQRFASNKSVLEMMIVSMVGFQVDEFMESVACPAYAENLDQLHALIDDILTRLPTEPTKNHSPTHRNLTSLTTFFLSHPSITNTSIDALTTLHNELSLYLHAHTTQSQYTHSPTPLPPLSTWLRTTAAAHVALPHSLTFYIASSISPTAFSTATAKYFLSALSQHLATGCRIANDIGSVPRDTAEGNLNAVMFPEFEGCDDVQGKKRQLLDMFAYEGRCVEGVVEAMEREGLRGVEGDKAMEKAGRWEMDMLRLFVDVAGVYNQLYLVKDLSNRVVVEG